MNIIVPNANAEVEDPKDWAAYEEAYDLLVEDGELRAGVRAAASEEEAAAWLSGFLGLDDDDDWTEEGVRHAVAAIRYDDSDEDSDSDEE